MYKALLKELGVIVSHIILNILLVIDFRCVEMVQFLQFGMQGWLRVYLPGMRGPERRLIRGIGIGLDDGIDGGLDSIKVDMQQDDVVFVDFLYVIAHPLARLVQPLRIVDDGRLEIGAVVVVSVQFCDVFAGEGVAVEG